MPVLLTPAEVAEHLGVCRASVYKLIGTGELAATRIGSLYRVPLEALVALLERRSISPGSGK